MARLYGFMLLVCLLVVLGTCKVPYTEKIWVPDIGVKMPKVITKQVIKPKPQVPPLGDLLKGVRKYKLKNGLTVIFKENHQIPFVSVFLCFKVGSVNETKGITGISHLLEHMIFKGSENYSRQQVDKIAAMGGGVFNGFTSYDITAYWCQLSSDMVEEALKIMVDWMTRCTINPDEFEPERNVVIQDLNRDLDDPEGKLFYELRKRVFKKHPYNHPVAGFLEDLQKITRQQVVEYYRKYYVPNNAILVVVGDAKQKKVMNLVKKYFGGIPKAKPIKVSFPKEPPQKGEQRIEIPTEYESDRFAIAYKTDLIGSKTDYVLDVISHLLSFGRRSRLYKRLVEREKLVLKINTWNGAKKYAGDFCFNVLPRKEANIKKIENIITLELEKLKTGKISKKELQRCKNNLYTGFIYQLESQVGYTIALGRYEAIAPNGIDYLNTYLSEIYKITPEDIAEVAKKYFRNENKTIVILRGKGKKSLPSKTPPRKKHKDCFAQITEGVSAGNLGKVTKVRLENGLTVIINQKMDLPIVNIESFTRASRLYEPEGKAGLANLVGEMLDEGTYNFITRKAMSYEEIAEQIEFIGARLHTSATGISMKLLSKDLEKGLDIFRDILVYPSFPQDRFKEIKQRVKSAIISRRDDPRYIARRLFDKNIYKEHPFEHPELGYMETVEKITRHDLISYYRRHFRPENTIIAIAGKVDPEAFILEIEKRFTEWASVDKYKPGKLPVVKRQKKPVIIKETRDTKQAHIYMGHAGISRYNPDFYALRVMDYILGIGPGFADRLSTIIREKHGLSYEVWGYISHGTSETQGQFIIYAGVKPADKDKAIKLIKEEVLGKFLKEGPTKEELKNAKAYLLKRFARVWETTEDIAWYLIYITRYNLGLDYHKKYKRAIESITKEDVIRVARKYINPDAMTIVIVSP
jgi:zinc protease